MVFEKIASFCNTYFKLIKIAEGFDPLIALVQAKKAAPEFASQFDYLAGKLADVDTIVTKILDFILPKLREDDVDFSESSELRKELESLNKIDQDILTKSKAIQFSNKGNNEHVMYFLNGVRNEILDAGKDISKGLSIIGPEEESSNEYMDDFSSDEQELPEDIAQELGYTQVDEERPMSEKTFDASVSKKRNRLGEWDKRKSDPEFLSKRRLARKLKRQKLKEEDPKTFEYSLLRLKEKEKEALEARKEYLRNYQKTYSKIYQKSDTEKAKRTERQRALRQKRKEELLKLKQEQEGKI